MAISRGMEITDQTTGAIWCVTIKNGDWNKVQGTCDAVASSTPSTQTAAVVIIPEVTPLGIETPTPTPTIVPEVTPLGTASTTDQVGPGGSPISTPAATPVVSTTPTPSPEVTATPTDSPQATPTPTASVSPESTPAVAPTESAPAATPVETVPVPAADSSSVTP